MMNDGWERKAGGGETAVTSRPASSNRCTRWCVNCVWRISDWFSFWKILAGMIGAAGWRGQ
jgi:hypothetical protein